MEIFLVFSVLSLDFLSLGLLSSIASGMQWGLLCSILAKSLLKQSSKRNGLEPVWLSIPQLVSLFLLWNPTIPPPLSFVWRTKQPASVRSFHSVVLFVIIGSINSCDSSLSSDSKMPLFTRRLNFIMGHPRSLSMQNVRNIITIYIREFWIMITSGKSCCMTRLLISGEKKEVWVA